MLIKLIRNKPQGNAITGRLIIDGRWFCDTLERKGYEILDVILIKLEDDTCALLYTTENRFEDENVSYGSLTKLLLKTFQKGKEK